MNNLLTYLLHPPGRTDKNLCRCFGAPVRRVFPDHLITYLPRPLPTAYELAGNDVRAERPQAGRDQTALWSVLGSHVADFPFAFH